MPARSPTKSANLTFLQRIISACNDPQNFLAAAVLVVVAEIVLNLAIIVLRPYTEIDWKAYMQEVEGFLSGERDYTKMKGDTGPLVYPAGFLYLFGALFHITDSGVNIRLAQYIWLGLYIYTLVIVLAIYKKSQIVPPWALCLLCISYRIHSIFVLRLFNDCFAVALCYTAILLFVNNQWAIGCMFYSFAVSVKMNILLYAPGLLVVLLQNFGFFWTIPYLAICGIIQLLLGLPFLLTFPVEYLKTGFDLGRVFFYKWTVNWKFVPEDIFLSKQFAMALLATQLILLGVFAYSRWRHLPWGLGKLAPKSNLSADHILRVLFTSNFIGIVCSRTLHYQFYVWYFHTLPYLLLMGPYVAWQKVIILVQLDAMWVIFPSNFYSSLILFCAHLLVLGGVLFSSTWAKPKTKKT